jgi:hypothetical protein
MIKTEHRDVVDLSELEKEGYVGSDMSLEVSLFEYQAAWKYEAGKLLFIYYVGGGLFDETCYEEDYDFMSDFSWVSDYSWKSMFDYLGMTSEEWHLLPLPIRISDLLRYSGYDNCMGATHWSGFKIDRQELEE